MEKVESIEKRLNELVENVKKSLSTGLGNRRSAHANRRPSWVVQLFESLDEILAGLATVKKTLSTRTSTGNGHSPDSLARAKTEAELQDQSEPVPLAITESRRQARPVADALERPFTTAPPDQLAPKFDCDYEDIVPNLNEAKFKEFSSHRIVKEKGYFKVSVQRLPPLVMQDGLVIQPGKDHCTSFSCQRESRGFVQLTRARNREVTIPSFPLPETSKESWSPIDLKDLWEHILENPPRDMDYVIGEPLFSDIELSPGQELERRGGRNLPGIGTTYVYLSFGVTCSIMHGEDIELRSINLLRSGAHKSWLVVPPAYAEKLRQKMRQRFPTMVTCSQALRHLSCLITPSQLDEWAIPYSLDYCKPDEAMVTEPGAFHEVINMGPNYAIAINFLYCSLPAIPKDYRFCPKSCGPHPLTAAHFEIQTQRPLAEVQAKKVARPPLKPIATEHRITGTRTTATLTKELLQEPTATGRKRKAPLAEIQRSKSGVAPQIRILSEAVCREEAFHRVCTLIRSCRDQSKPLFEINKGINPTVRFLRVISATEGRSQLIEFVNRFAKVGLACDIENGKAGRTSADPEAINKLMVSQGWEKTQQNRTRLYSYIKEGRRWKKLCGSFDGLLCLIPPNRYDREAPQRISGHTYYDLNRHDIEQFHSLLGSDEFTSLHRMGNTLQMSILQNVEVPEFKWESEDPLKIARLSIKELAPFMEEFPLIKESVWNFEKYDWPKPDCWLWGWPKHPGWIPPSDTQCDLCKKSECNCIVSCVPEIQPRLTNELGKGQGVRAVDVYEKGQILGELLGEFVPLDTFNNGWPMEFRRPDLSDEPVAQIYPKEMGNWVRKVNHSCDPSAEFRVMKISKMWRQMIVAIRDVSHNEEITAFCGSNFLRGQGKACACSKCIN